jgi:ubiquitin C-terminal hydrolase
MNNFNQNENDEQNNNQQINQIKQLDQFNTINKGNPNLGNTCFFNSVLQLLIQCTVLNKLLIENNINGTLIDIYKRYLESYIDSNNSKKTSQAEPGEIVKYVSKLLGRNMWSQEDADQYVTFIIDAIVDEFKEWAKKNPNLIVSNKTMSLDQLIMGLFTIKCSKKIYCSECGYVSETNDDINKLYLPLASLETNKKVKSDTNLSSLFNAYLTDKLDNENRWKCEKCNCMIMANIERTIYKWPKYLLITLKRYANNNHKINTEIEMPPVFSLEEKTFYLRGFIYHMGSTHGGHYVYYGKKNDKWYLYNDSSVTETSNDQIEQLTKTGYVYLYVSK